MLVEQGWSPEKLLTARMTSSTRMYVADNLNVKSLPEPAVLVGERRQVRKNFKKHALFENKMSKQLKKCVYYNQNSGWVVGISKSRMPTVLPLYIYF